MWRLNTDWSISNSFVCKHQSCLTAVRLSANSVKDKPEILWKVSRSRPADILQLRCESTMPYTSLKLLLVGESGVGKTSLTIRFTSGLFNSIQASTIGIEFRSKLVEKCGSEYTVFIYDSAGQEKFRCIPPIYYRGADAIVFVYDVTDRRSFNQINFWLNDFNDKNTNPNAVKMLIGNKIDVVHERVVLPEEGAKFASNNNMLFMETSAATSERVKEAFDGLIDMAIKFVESREKEKINKERASLARENDKFYQLKATEPGTEWGKVYHRRETCCAAKMQYL